MGFVNCVSRMRNVIMAQDSRLERDRRNKDKTEREERLELPMLFLLLANICQNMKAVMIQMSICDCPGTAAKAQIESSYFGSSLSLCWICWLHRFQFLAWLLALQCHGTCTNFRLNSFFLHFLCWTCPGNQQGSTRLKASEAIIMLASAMDAANAATKPSSHSLETLGHKRTKCYKIPPGKSLTRAGRTSRGVCGLVSH